MAGTSSNIPTGVIRNEENVSTEADLSSAACFPITSAAIPAIRSPTPTPQLPGNAESIQSDSVQAKQRVFMCANPDIEDCGNLLSTQKKKSRADDTLFHRFRGRRGLFVTDVTKTEWCEKQMELSLFHEQQKNNEVKRGEERCSQKQIDSAIVFGGRRKNNKAIKAGIDRHVELQLEVLKPVSVKMKSREDYMAVKLVNFINGVNQLRSNGLTREIPIVSFDFVQGIWMVGKIDEVQMPKVENDHNPILVETKTRSKEEVPSEPQKRKGRIQLMCYKYLWDNLVALAHHDFPSKQLYEYFELNSQHILCEDLKAVCAAEFGITALTLDDVVICYQNTCKMLPPAHDQLVLRYESQKDQSLLDEEKFTYNDDFIKSQIQNCLEFWLGQREASYVAEEEKWKCGFCYFRSQCPAWNSTESTETE